MIKIVPKSVGTSFLSEPWTSSRGSIIYAKHLIKTFSSFNGERFLPVTGKDPLRGSHSPAPYLPTAPQFSQQMVTSNHR